MNTEYINQRQIARLYALARANGITSKEVDFFIKNVLKYESKKLILCKDYDSVCTRLITEIPQFVF